MNLSMLTRNLRGNNNADEPETDAAPDALELIHQQHEEVNGLFEQALSDETPSPQRRQIITRICDMLTMHAKMEETIFYPALRKAGKTRERDSVLEAGEEHGVVKDMIAKIRKVVGRDETLNAKVKVLKELVQHHVEEEESTMFEEARAVLGSRLEDLGEEIQRFTARAQRGGGAGRKAPGRKKTAARNAPARKAAPAGRKTAAAARKAPARKTAARGRKGGR